MWQILNNVLIPTYVLVLLAKEDKDPGEEKKYYTAIADTYQLC